MPFFDGHHNLELYFIFKLRVQINFLQNIKSAKSSKSVVTMCFSSCHREEEEEEEEEPRHVPREYYHFFFYLYMTW